LAADLETAEKKRVYWRSYYAAHREEPNRKDRERKRAKCSGDE